MARLPATIKPARSYEARSLLIYYALEVRQAIEGNVKEVESERRLSAEAPFKQVTDAQPRSMYSRKATISGVQNAALDESLKMPGVVQRLLGVTGYRLCISTSLAVRPIAQFEEILDRVTRYGADSDGSSLIEHSS